MFEESIINNFSMQRKMLQNEHCNATRPFVTIRATMSSAEKSSEALQSEALQKEFGNWLKTQRVQAGLTQIVVAHGADIDRVQLAKIETGVSGTKRDTVIAIVESINRKTTNHRIDINEALDRYYGRWKGLVTQQGLNTFNIESTFEIIDGMRLQFDVAFSMQSQQKEKLIEAIKMVALGALAQSNPATGNEVKTSDSGQKSVKIKTKDTTREGR